MHNQPLSKRSLAKVKADIATAYTYAEQHNVPLTAERLAAALDMDLVRFRQIVEGRYTEKGVDDQALRGKISVIQSAFAQANASVMEHAMQRGSGTNMHMLYLKENAGYGEAPTEMAAVTPVIFWGEEEIPE